MLLNRGIILLLTFVATISAQRRFSSARNAQTQSEIIRDLSKSAEDFSLELFAKVSDLIAGKKNNCMISPFSIWALLLLITEGANDKTRTQLEKALRIENTPSKNLRSGFKHIQNILTVNTSTIEVSTSQAIFNNNRNRIKQGYLDVIKDYDAQLKDIDFQKVSAALDEMNSYIKYATRGLIEPALQPSDIKDADMVMISSIYFKGAWKLPFEPSQTKVEYFYDENENIIGDCQMMTLSAPFNYAPIVEMQAHVVELPYGKEDRLSMILIVPKKGTRLNDAISNLRKVGLQKILDSLQKDDTNMDDSEVELFLPKFITTTSLVMNAILDQMGIEDVFQPDLADLSNISAQKLHLSQLIHQTKIEVNEEGTVATAISSATFSNKASPPRFYLNRPFAYIIVEKETRSLLFCGHVTKPVYNK